MPKTKSGEQITWREFMKRWKEGMQNLTPVQRTQNDIGSTWITLIGFIAALVALVFFNKTFGVLTYGLILIFLGSTYANIVKLFSLYGQYNLYRSLESNTEDEAPSLIEKEVEQ